MKAKMIKSECCRQNELFVKWDQQKKYDMFHHSHYDWWAFPIDQPSSHGDKYQIGQEEFDLLRNDNEFIDTLRSNCILVCKSWGYNLVQGREYLQSQTRSDQRWQRWPIRLYKMAKSLQLFEQDLFKHAIRYGIMLIDRGYKFVYSMKRLDIYFQEKDVYTNQLNKKQITSKEQRISKSLFKPKVQQKKQQNLHAHSIFKSNQQKNRLTLHPYTYATRNK